MMNKILLLTGVILISLALFAGGILLGQANAQDFQPGSMMGGFPGNFQGGYPMMGNNCGAAAGGMMSGQFGGMMGGFDNQNNGEPLSIAEVETAVANYLEDQNDGNLLLGEIMIFDNHAYAQVLNGETGQGAFELLVDNDTANVFPEPGPNMMWNTAYGMMNGQYGTMMGGTMMGGGMMGGQYGGMMGNWDIDPDAEIEVSAEEAVQLAQEYLDANLTGLTAGDHAAPFPGYYTLHVQRDGNITGMLSVNAFNGQVFYHHWHGNFVEMSAEDHAG